MARRVNSCYFRFNRQQKLNLYNSKFRSFHGSSIKASLAIGTNFQDSLNPSSEKASRNRRDVPFMFLPHTVKKAYDVQEVKLKTPKLLEKYKWLTKTISTEGFPNGVILEPDSMSDDFVDMFCSSVMKSVIYQKKYTNREKPTFIDERIKFNMINNFIRISMLEGAQKEHLKGENSFLLYEPLLVTHWPRNYKFYQTKFRPTFVLRTKNKLDVLEHPRELTKAEVDALPGPYDTYAMNLHRQHIVHLQNHAASDMFLFNPNKHCHTTITVRNRLEDDEQFYSLGIITMFAQLCAQAQAEGVLHGTDLQTPLVTQCIVTNGHRIAFMMYQLNTLHLLDDKGVWNRGWFSPVYEMYQQRCDVFPMIFESAVAESFVQNFQSDFCKFFAGFIQKDTL